MFRAVGLTGGCERVDLVGQHACGLQCRQLLPERLQIALSILELHLQSIHKHVDPGGGVTTVTGGEA
jgi:hypothetical protein